MEAFNGDEDSDCTERYLMIFTNILIVFQVIYFLSVSIPTPPTMELWWCAGG